MNVFILLNYCNTFILFTNKMKKTKKKKYIVWGTIVGVIAALLIGFFGWTAVYYHADATAVNISISDSTIQRKDGITVIPAENSSTAIIFYPGAKVEDIAYLPLLQRIRNEVHVTCILVKMPLNLALFGVNKADQVMADYPDVETWYLAGHSLGGAMASSYAAKHEDKIAGLILMGSYIYGNYPASKSLTIYGSLNTAVKDKITYSENVVCIEGGNHAQFGNYGKQKGDADATISADAQQIQTVQAIKSFLQK